MSKKKMKPKPTPEEIQAVEDLDAQWDEWRDEAYEESLRNQPIHPVKVNECQYGCDENSNYKHLYDATCIRCPICGEDYEEVANA